MKSSYAQYDVYSGYTATGCDVIEIDQSISLKSLAVCRTIAKRSNANVLLKLLYSRDCNVSAWKNLEVNGRMASRPKCIVIQFEWLSNAPSIRVMECQGWWGYLPPKQDLALAGEYIAWDRRYFQTYVYDNGFRTNIEETNSLAMLTCWSWKQRERRYWDSNNRISATQHRHINKRSE